MLLFFHGKARRIFNAMSKTRGLTLGKFAPLHKGYQLVIETALREMDEVVTIV